MRQATGVPWWQPKTPQVYMRVALEADRADVRREALKRVISSRQVTSDWAFEGLAAIARLDENGQVRCVALRGLGHFSDDRPAAVVLDVLTADAEAARPPDPHVRWEAIRLLNQLSAAGHWNDAQREPARQVLVDQLDPGRHRNVRQAAAVGLRYFPERDTLARLIEALRDPDFGVVLEAEESLVTLTGTTHDFDPDAWTAWLAAAENPFAHAGRPVEGFRPSRQSWWDRTKAIFQ